MSENRFERTAAVYAIAVGALMGAMWVFFLVTGQVSELESRPAEIVLHLVAEFGTALMLVIGGSLSLRRAVLGTPLLTLGLGMLLYTLVVSPGYYLDRGEAVFVVMFGVLFVCTVVFAFGLIRNVAASTSRTT